MQRKPIADILLWRQQRSPACVAARTLWPTFSRPWGTFPRLSDFWLRVRDLSSRLGDGILWSDPTAFVALAITAAILAWACQGAFAAEFPLESRRNSTVFINILQFRWKNLAVKPGLF
jgi:hypothetical protein